MIYTLRMGSESHLETRNKIIPFVMLNTTPFFFMPWEIDVVKTLQHHADGRVTFFVTDALARKTFIHYTVLKKDIMITMVDDADPTLNMIGKTMDQFMKTPSLSTAKTVLNSYLMFHHQYFDNARYKAILSNYQIDILSRDYLQLVTVEIDNLRVLKL